MKSPTPHYTYNYDPAFCYPDYSVKNKMVVSCYADLLLGKYWILKYWVINFANKGLVAPRQCVHLMVVPTILTSFTENSFYNTANVVLLLFYTAR